MEKKIFKSFEIIEKESSKSGNKYYLLSVTAQNGKSAEMFMSESQKDLYDLTPAENRSVEIAQRKSKAGNDYECICLKLGEDSFDFFPKDRAFLSLAKRLAAK